MKRFLSTRETVNGTVWEVWEACDDQETADFLHVRRGKLMTLEGPLPFTGQAECFQVHLEDLLHLPLVRGLPASEEAARGT